MSLETGSSGHTITEYLIRAGIEGIGLESESEWGDSRYAFYLRRQPAVGEMVHISLETAWSHKYARKRPSSCSKRRRRVSWG